MTWHTFPHVPEAGAMILVQYKGCPENNLFKMHVQGSDEFSHIKKWCYEEDYLETKNRRLLNE